MGVGVAPLSGEPLRARLLGAPGPPGRGGRSGGTGQHVGVAQALLDGKGTGAHVDELEGVSVAEVIGPEVLGEAGGREGRSDDVVAQELAVERLALDAHEDVVVGDERPGQLVAPPGQVPGEHIAQEPRQRHDSLVGGCGAPGRQPPGAGPSRKPRPGQPWERLAAPDSDRLAWERDRLDGQLHDLETKQTKRQAWLEAHPEAARRLARLDQDLRAVEAGERVRQALDRLQIRDGLPLSSPEQTLRRS